MCIQGLHNVVGNLNLMNFEKNLIRAIEIESV